MKTIRNFNFERVKASIEHFWNTVVLGNNDERVRQPSIVQENNHQTKLYGLHNILKYDQYDDRTGLFFNDNSISFCLEVVAQTGADDEMIARLTTLFTPIPPNHGVQWCLFGHPMLEKEMEAYLDQRHIAVDHNKTTPFFLDLAKRRVEHVLKDKGQPLWPSSNYVIKTISLFFSVTRTASPTNKTAVVDMEELQDILLASLRTSGLPAFPVNAQGLINFLWPILNPEAMFNRSVIHAPLYDTGKSIKEQVTAFGQHVQVKAKEVLFGLPPEDDQAADQRIAMRSFGVLQYPNKKELWEMANIVGSFFDEGLQYPCPFLICGGIYTLDPDVVNTKAQLKGARTKQNAQSKMATFQPELQMQAEDWNIVLYQLNNGSSMCELYHTLTLFAPCATINRASQIAINIWRNERFSICPLQMMHLPALYASLPMTLTENLRDDLKTIRLITNKTTVNAVDMSPVIGEWKNACDPIMMFFGRRGSPIFFDFYSNQQGNYNVFVAGVSGSGKSVTMNEIVSAYRGIGARVWVIDVGRSYQNLIKLQKGTFLEFTPDTKLCINPFSWVGLDNELDFKAEMRMLKPMIGRMASPNSPLSEFQYSLISEAIINVWKDYGQATNPTLISHYLQSNIKNESGGIERAAYELAKQLQSFTTAGIFGNLFNGRANISLDDDMVGLELEELKDAPELRRVVLFVLTSRIAHDMYLSRDRKKLCLVDEAWQLLGDDKETGDFLEEGFRRARKYHGIFCIGTQGVEDAFKNPAARAAYNNADWKILLRQEKNNLEKLIDDGMVNFSPALKRMLLSLRTEKGRFSEMIISSPNGDALVRHIPDPFSLLMTSTNAADFTECKALLDSGYSTIDALEIMLARRDHFSTKYH